MSSYIFRKVRHPLKGLSRTVREALGIVPSFAGLKTAIWIAAGLLLVALVYLAQSSNAALIARNQSVKEARIAELMHEDALLRYEIAEATSPPNIERRALALGLSPAKHVVYASLPDLKVDMAEVMPAFAPKTVDNQIQDTPTQSISPFDEVKALLGFGTVSDHVEAQSR